MIESTVIGVLLHLAIAFVAAYFLALIIREKLIYSATWLASKSGSKTIHRIIHYSYKLLALINRHIWPLPIVWSYYQDTLFDVFHISGIILAAIYALWLHWTSVAEEQCVEFENENYRV